MWLLSPVDRLLPSIISKEKTTGNHIRRAWRFARRPDLHMDEFPERCPLPAPVNWNGGVGAALKGRPEMPLWIAPASGSRLCSGPTVPLSRDPHWPGRRHRDEYC